MSATACCCILLKFYIKPQRQLLPRWRFVVVSYWNSTSNHNLMTEQPYNRTVVSYWNSTSNHNHSFQRSPSKSLYLIEILHQTTTRFSARVRVSWLYLIEILHQTTTRAALPFLLPRCILLKFYIKPQQVRDLWQGDVVVSYWNSTSNHNC